MSRISRRAFAAAAAPAEPGPLQTDAAPGVPLVPQGVALEMTECEVVKRIGPAEREHVVQLRAGPKGKERYLGYWDVESLRPTLVETAPGTKSMKFWEADADAWAKVIETNVVGTYYMARAAAP